MAGRSDHDLTTAANWKAWARDCERRADRQDAARRHRFILDLTPKRAGIEIDLLDAICARIAAVAKGA